MVMAASISKGECCPSIIDSAVDFCLPASWVYVLPRACNYYVILSYRAAWVPMASILHFRSRFKLILSRLSSNGNDLIHLEHRLWKLVEISSTHNVNTCVIYSHLDSLEIMREISSGLYGVWCYRLGLCVVKVKPLWVLLHYVYHQVLLNLLRNDLSRNKRGCRERRTQRVRWHGSSELLH